MRILFTVSAWASHWFPMVPTAWALQARGHDVRVACAPSQADAVGRAGLAAVPVLDGPPMMFKARLARYWGAQAGRAAGTPPPPGSVLHPVTGEPLARLEDFDLAGYAAAHREANLAMMREGCDRIVEYARWWRPDLVVSDPLAVEGVLVARLLGVPAVASLFGLVGTHETGPGLNLVAEDHSESFTRYGLPEMSADLIDHVIDPAPPSVPSRSAAPRLPVRYVPYNGPGDAPPWAQRPPESGRPRVLLAWSTSLSELHGEPSRLAPMILSALAGLDAEVLVAAVDRDRRGIGPLPANARVLDRWCPLWQLVPGSAAVVHHGGGGSVLTAAQAGVPQLGLAFAEEQEANARRVAAVGAGHYENGYTVTPETVRERVEALLERPGPRAAADRLRAEIMELPLPAELAAQLERLAGRAVVPVPVPVPTPTSTTPTSTTPTPTTPTPTTPTSTTPTSTTPTPTPPTPTPPPATAAQPNPLATGLPVAAQRTPASSPIPAAVPGLIPAPTPAGRP